MQTDLIKAFGKTLAETEWQSPEDLHAYQLSLLSPLLSHARAATEFYAQRLDFDVGDPQQIEQAWPSIPILTRAVAAACPERLFSRSPPARTGHAVEAVTSGSTGTPLRHRKSNIAKVAGQALTERAFRWWQLDGSKPMARISFDPSKETAPPSGATMSGWCSTHPEGVHHVLSSEADVATQIDWLAARKPAYLTSISIVFKQLALACMRDDRKLGFERLVSFGTLLDSDTREHCRAAFGAEIVDTYGASEIGHLAAQCAECGEYHVGAEAVKIEILRADGSPARPGEIGRVIATSLYNYAMPVIRYELGDLAEAGSERAACGRGLPSLRRILGRYRNAFRFRDGAIAFPRIDSYRLWEFVPLRQAQIVQLDFDRVEIRWVGEEDRRPIDLASITERVRLVLRRPVDVSLRKVDRIERSASGKFEEVISLVPAGDGEPAAGLR